MYEFEAVSVSTYEAASLAAKLTEKSADGWEVVAIVPAGSDVTAYLRKSTDAAAVTTTAQPADDTAAAATTPATTGEPAGWGTAPAASTAATTSSWGSGANSTETATGWGSGAVAASATPTEPAQQQATPAVPAGWYHDPAGRFELRYWDGSAWTEHVSRAGQQYTDPPVA